MEPNFFIDESDVFISKKKKPLPLLNYDDLTKPQESFDKNQKAQSAMVQNKESEMNILKYILGNFEENDELNQKEEELGR